MSGYTRQQSYIDGDVILAEHTNDEFDLLAEVFDTSLGHKHDGTAAEGPTISVLSDNDGDTKIQVEEGANDNIIRFDTLGVERLIVDNSGTIIATGDAIFNGTVDMNSTVTVDGATTFSTRPAFNGGTTGVDSPFTVDSTFLVANLNSQLLDNFTSTQFLRSDVADQVDGVLTYAAIPVFNGGTSGVSAPFTVDSNFLVTNLNADLLDGNEATAFLGVSAKAADSELLDGLDSSQFVRSDTTDTVAGVLTFSAIPAFNGGTSGVSAPFTADSTFLVTNLNADLLDGQHGSYYAALSEDETVAGSWSFSNPATFNSSIISNFTTSFNSDVFFTSGSIPAFNGGTSGASAPFTVDSTFLVTDLNADLLDGVQGDTYMRLDQDNVYTDTDFIIRANTGDGSDSSAIRLYGGGSGSNTRGARVELYGNEHAFAGAIDLFSGVAGGGINLHSGGSSNIIALTSGTERLRIDSSGKVGIGTDSPDTALNIGNGGVLRVDGSSTGYAEFGPALTTGGAFINASSGSDSSTFIDFNAFDISTAPLTYRLGRNTNTSGNVNFIIYAHDGTSGVSLTLSKDGTIAAGNGASNILKLATVGAERARIDSSGSFLVGKATVDTTTDGFAYGSDKILRMTNSAMAATWNRNAADGNIMDFRRANTIVGSISVTASATAYNTSSDYRLKTNVVDLTGAADRLMQLSVRRFEFLSEPGKTVDGFLAHEAQAVVPEAVTGEKDAMTTEEYEVEPAVYDDEGNVVTPAVMGTREVPEYQAIDQSKLVPLLTAALQEALTEIDSLKTRVSTLEAA